jgi:hypothetical protein
MWGVVKWMRSANISSPELFAFAQKLRYSLPVDAMSAAEVFQASAAGSHFKIFYA